LSDGVNRLCRFHAFIISCLSLFAQRTVFPAPRRNPLRLTARAFKPSPMASIKAPDTTHWIDPYWREIHPASTGVAQLSGDARASEQRPMSGAGAGAGPSWRR
jgi:hypothetical protein